MLKKMTDKREDGKRKKFVAHCDVCGKCLDLKKDIYTAFQPKSRGTQAYVCSDCMRVESYFTRQEKIRWGTSNAHGFTYGFEFEIIPMTEASHALLISRDYGMIATYDGSIAPYGGIEFKTLVYDSLNGVKQSFRTVEENMAFCYEYEEHFGTHIHIGHGTRYNWNFYNWLYNYSYELFDCLGKYLQEHPGLCKQVFGRCLTHYADWPCNYQGHGSFVNISNATNIEWRIPQFQNATQYFWAVCLCKEFTKALLDGFEKNTSPDRVGEKLVKLFNKHCKGLMNYQRPERNSK